VDEARSVLLGGAWAAGLDLGGGELAGSDGGIFVAKLDGAGAHQWSRGFATAAQGSYAGYVATA
jgi:hypothetical protein